MACALIPARAATPVATWTNFSNPSSGSYTLDIDDSCIIGPDGSVTIGANGGLALTLPAGDTLRTGKLITIVADVEGILPTGDKRTVFAVKTANGNFANLTKNADNVIYSKANDTASYGNIGNVSSIGRAQLAYAYSHKSGTDAWVESAKQATSGSLRWQDNELTDIFIGSYDGASQAMQGLKIRKLTIYADKLVSASEICPDGPAYLYKFNGNYDSLGSSALTFNSSEKADNYSASPSGQALKIVDGSTHPYGGDWSYGSGNWCVSTFAKPIANASSKIVLWTTGKKGGWFGLLSDSANNKAILASGDGTGITTTICSVDVPDITAFFHLYTVRFVGGNTYELIVDGDVAGKSSATYATAIPKGDFQIGAVKNGLPTGFARTTGTLIDDLREHQRAVSDEEIQTLAASFVTPETISINIGGGRGTGELAANSDHLVQTSECVGLAPVPGAGWNNIAYQWNNGGMAKEIAAGSVKATDGIRLVSRDAVAVTVSAKNTYDGGVSRVNSFHKGYLDDGVYNGHRSYVKVTGIPYSRYNVIIYAATDATGVQYSPYKVNGTQYTWNNATVQGTTAWGDRGETSTAYGKNALIVQGVNGSTLEVEGTATGGRGGIAAVQIVSLPTMNYTANVANTANWSALDWSPEKPAGGFPAGVDFTVINTAATAMLTLNEDVDALKLTVVGAAGKNLTLAKGSGVSTSIGAFDFAGAEGRVTVGFDTDAAAVIAGGDTVVNAGGTGTLTIGDGMTATVMNGVWDGTVGQTDGSTLRLEGTAELASVSYLSASAGKVVYAAPFADQTAADGVQFAGTLTREFDTGFSLRTTRFVLGNNGGAVQVFTQNSGDLTVTGSTGPGSNKASVLLGHYGNGENTTYNLNGGTFTSTNAAIQLGWDGSCYFTIAGGILRTKGIASGNGRNQPATFTLNSGALELGDYGIQAAGANASYTLNGGKVRAYSNATITVAHTNGLKIAGAVAFEAAEGMTLRINSDNVTAGGLITIGGAGTVVFRNYREAATVTGTAKVGYTVNVNDLGKFQIPSGMSGDDIKLFDKNGNEVALTGHDEEYLYFDLDLYGKSCLMEYLYKGNLNSTGTDTGSMVFDGTHCFSGNEYVTNALGETAGGIYAASAPYRGVSFPSEVTVVTYGKIMATSNTCQIGIGSTTGGSKYSLFLASGDVAKNEVVLGYAYNNSGGNVAEHGTLCRMTVPNAQTAAHLYAFTMQQVGTKTEVHVYLDGKVLQPYTFDSSVTLGSGIQLGSIHGGIGNTQDWPDDFGFKRSTAAETEATISFLRVYDQKLDEAVIERIAQDYPYVSSGGKATRTIGADGTWKQTGMWLQSSTEGPATTQDAPNDNTVVGVTMTGDATVEMNLGWQANYEQFEIGGSGKLTLTQGSGAVAPVVVGRSKINTDMTVSSHCFLFGGNVDLAAGKTLTFDFASLDLGAYYSSTIIKLTGVATLGEGAQVQGVNLVQVAGRTAEFVQDGATQQYRLVITVEDHPFVYTVDQGAATGTWSWNGVAVSADVVLAQTSGMIEKRGSGTALLAQKKGFSYEVTEGVLKFASVVTETTDIKVSAGATFDANGMLHSKYRVTLAGGALVNNGSAIGDSSQTETLALTADSTVGGLGDFAIQASSYGPTTINLDKHTLTKSGTNQLALVTSSVKGSGTFYVKEGTVYSSESTIFDAGVTLRIGKNGTYRQRGGARVTSVSAIVGESGTLDVSGSVSNFTLRGTLKIAGSGTFGTIALDDATLDIGTMRGLTLADNGKVNVTLTAEEESGEARQIDLFTPAPGASISLNKVTNSAGEDVTGQCSLDGGRIKIGQEAQIGTVKYATLAGAIAAVRDGQTIELLSSATLSGSVTNAFSLDIRGNVLTGLATDVNRGFLRIVDTSADKGRFELQEQLSVSGDRSSRLVLNTAMAAVGGSVLVKCGTLANESVTALDEISLVIEKDGTLDLSAGTEVRCLDFKSSGTVVGANATLVVKGTLNATVATVVGKISLADGATLKGAGLKVTSLLTLGNALVVEADKKTAENLLAEVPDDKKTYATTAKLRVGGGYENYEIRHAATRLFIADASAVTASVDVDVIAGENFESMEVRGVVSDWGGYACGTTNVYVIATAEKTGVAVTQAVEYVSGPSGSSGTFLAKIGNVAAGDTYTVSVRVDIGSDETKARQDVDTVVARPVDEWIFEDADTFAGQKPGTGLWVGKNGSACSTNDVIRFLVTDWSVSTDFQPTNDTLAVRSSLVRDIHYRDVIFDCPGFYLSETNQTVLSGQLAAITVVMNEEDDANCFFAIVKSDKWELVPRTVFAPELGRTYELVVRVDYSANEILYSVVSGGNTTRLASCPIGQSQSDIELTFMGSGDVAEIAGICQDAHLAQVGDEEEYWTIGDAMRAAGNTNSIIPLWRSRYEITGDAGLFRLLDPHGYLTLVWKKWHHYFITKDGLVQVYDYLSGNNWIEYADESGVVHNANGVLLVTNEVGLAWIAESATNRWFRGNVTLGAPLDLSSKNWTPVAQFSGMFDGDGYVIQGLNNTNVVAKLGAAGCYFGGPTNDWGQSAYGLFASATNAEFRNVAFEGVAISNVSETVAPLLGMLAGGSLKVSNVTVGPGLVQGAGGAIAGLVGTAKGWSGISVVSNVVEADVAAVAASGVMPRWAAGVMTVGGTNDTVGPLVVTGNVVRSMVANTLYNNENGGNVAQILAGTTWGTKYGEVLVTNNVAEVSVWAEIVDHNSWRFDYETWVSEAFPTVNLAAAVVRTTDKGAYRRFVEATDPASVPIDPVYRTARMRADRFEDGTDNIAGWWMDTITAMPNGGHVDIVGTGNIIDLWESVLIDRDLSFNLNSNFVYTVYDNDTFTIANGARAAVTNGVIYVGKGYEAFGGDTAALTTNDVTVVKLDEDFYERTVLVVDGVFMSVSEAMDKLHAGSCIELFDGTGLTIDANANAVLLDGRKIADLPDYQSLAVAGAGDTVAYMVRLNEKAVPDYDFELTGVDSGSSTVKINVVGARKGFYYAVQHKASLVEKWPEPERSDWVEVQSDGSVIQFTLPASDSSGFYRIKVTDYLSEEE